MTDFYFEGFWRMDWGLGNPNKTAALIAMLMVAMWAFTFFRRWGFWMALALFAGLGVCLVSTYSRGGLVALAVGLVPLVIVADRPWPRRYLLALVGVVAVLTGYAVYMQAHERYVQGVVEEDLSVGNRLDLWSAAPRMMVDAPSGWGWGQAGTAYMQWYQPTGRTEGYRTMVNSHLTWMVEGGWWFRFLYVAAWAGVILLCWPTLKFPWMAVPLGIWLSFGVAAIFSSVAESPWLWILPGASLVVVIAFRIVVRQWPRPVWWVLPPAVAVFACGLNYLMGQIGDENPIQITGSPERVLIGGNNPGIWILADEDVMGTYYGKPLREHLQAQDSTPNAVGVATSSDLLPEMVGKILVIAGHPDWEATDSVIQNLEAISKLPEQ